MKNENTRDIIKRIIGQYKKYKLSLSEEHVVEVISSEIADELSRKFIIEPLKKYPRREKTNASDT